MFASLGQGKYASTALDAGAGAAGRAPGVRRACAKQETRTLGVNLNAEGEMLAGSPHARERPRKGRRLTWLLCDYGEVLSLPQPEADRAALQSTAGRPAEEFWKGYWRNRPAYDRADLPAVEYWSAVLGSRPSPEQLRRLVEIDVASWLHPNPETLAAASRAAGRGLRLALLSNAPTEVAASIDTQDWLHDFSPRLFSCRLGAVKPEPAVYAAVLEALGAPAGEVIFVDDRPANVEAARRAGIRAAVFAGPGQIDALGEA